MKQEEIDSATFIIDMAYECINEMGRKHNFRENEIMNILCQHHFGEDFGFLDDYDLATEIAEETIDLFMQCGIPYFGIGSYRICFIVDGLVMKANRYNFSWNSNPDEYRGENDDEVAVWQKFEGTEGADYILPIVKHFRHHCLGEVIFVPIAEEINDEYYDAACSIFSEIFQYSENEVANAMNRMMEMENFSDAKKDFCLQYAVAGADFGDDHRGNWGHYNGNLVCIDFSSFGLRYTSETRVVQEMKKYRKMLKV